MLFSGKTAIVTGAGSGIGQAVAEMLAEEGARVALADLFEEKAENTKAENSKPAVKKQDITADFLYAFDGKIIK